MAEPYLASAMGAVPIELVPSREHAAWLDALSPNDREQAQRHRFQARTGQVCWLGQGTDKLRVVAGWDGASAIAALGGLPLTLGEGAYRLSEPAAEVQLLGWGLGCYQFTRYRTKIKPVAQLVLPEGASRERLVNLVGAVQLARDLINTPAGDLPPSALAEEAAQVADAQGADCHILVGDDLLAQGFEAIHSVGRAAADAPRLIDITWGQPEHPLIVLVGKGVCFDSGGLNLKPAQGMRSMKKDMGGGAAALGLAQLIMAEALPVRLRLLIPAVENAVAGNAYRPGDILNTYLGLRVEIDNTDAEGRLILCDALALAAEDEPELMIDFATLTGSARSAVGTELSAMFCNDDDLADGLFAAGRAVDDPLWRLPLHGDYDHLLKSKVADTLNSAASPYGGAITAALFLEKFVNGIPWAHFDIMGYNVRSRPGRPEGGEAMAMRA
ncbi:MAG: leucyl aminopeptidase family protein, partial [Gammaproteobacteria bacterium]|nr:leucyl aminopeptidase family protein [Gammaproteobacteria bacterium]